MMEKIELVAKAISPEYWEEANIARMRGADLASELLVMQGNALRAARRAIEAMREPTDAMTEDGNRAYWQVYDDGSIAQDDLSRAYVRKSFTAMIDAILTSRPKAGSPK